MNHYHEIPEFSPLMDLIMVLVFFGLWGCAGFCLIRSDTPVWKALLAIGPAGWITVLLSWAWEDGVERLPWARWMRWIGRQLSRPYRFFANDLADYHARRGRYSDKLLDSIDVLGVQPGICEVSKKLIQAAREAQVTGEIPDWILAE